MIVVDASVIVVALLDDGDDGDQVRHRLRGEELAAPEIVDLEVISTCRRFEAAGQADARRISFALIDLTEMPVRRVPHRPLLARCWALRANLTPYDASYVALAEHIDAVLLTSDARLARAPGPTCRFEVLEPTGA